MEDAGHRAALEELERVLIGKDPFGPTWLIETMHRDSYWRTGAVFRSALSAIEAALLDIKGKALGVPVYELLGGKYRDPSPATAMAGSSAPTTPEQFADKAREGRGDGLQRR